MSGTVKGISVQPICFALSGMTVLEDFSLVTSRDLVPVPDVLEIASLIRFGAYLVMEGKRTQLFLEVIREQLCNLQRNIQLS